MERNSNGNENPSFSLWVGLKPGILCSGMKAYKDVLAKGWTTDDSNAK